MSTSLVVWTSEDHSSNLVGDTVAKKKKKDEIPTDEIVVVGFSIYLKHSACCMSVLDMDDVLKEDNSLSISRINVHRQYRGKGHGTRLLRAACEFADKNQYDLHLFVSASDGLDNNQLLAWYKRHGFRSHRSVPHYMKRNYRNANERR